MARKKKKGTVKLAGFRIPKPLAKSAANFAGTSAGKIILAEALVLGAGLLIRKPPAAAAASAVSAAEDAAVSAKHMAGGAGEAIADLLHAMADRLKQSAGAGSSTHASDRKPDQAAASGRNGRDHAKAEGNLDQDMLRQALLGERKKKGKKAKAAKRP